MVYSAQTQSRRHVSPVAYTTAPSLSLHKARNISVVSFMDSSHPPCVTAVRVHTIRTHRIRTPYRTTQATCRRKRRAKLPTQAMCADSHNLRFTMPAHVSTVHMSTPQAACHAVVGATTTSGAQPQTLILMRCAICWRAPGREHTAVWSARSVSLIEAGARGM